MKIRKLFITAGLAIAALVGVGAALSASPKAGAVQAEGEKTWMTHITLDLTDEVPEYPGFRSDLVQVHFWKNGTGSSDKYFTLHSAGASRYYTVNATFEKEYTFDRIQCLFNQGETSKWSTDYSIGVQSEESHNGEFNIKFDGSWSGDNWVITLNSYVTPYFKYNDVTYNFVEDVANARYVAENVPISVVGSDKYYVLMFGGKWSFTKMTLTDSTLANYFSDKGFELNDEWCVMKVAGTYDVFLKNDYNDNGVVEFKLHTESINTYIYYVTENEDVTPDYIYTFGATEQFGAFPGSKIVDVATDVTGVLHFNGAGVVRIYKIPVKIGGYKSGGDTGLVFAWYQDEYNNGQGSDQDLEAACAYYWDSRNANAGAAIDFLLKVEAKRNAVVAEGKIKNYSVCGISESDAAALYNEYAALTAPVKTIVNNSSTWTYKGDGTNDEDVIGFVDIMDQLAQMAEVGPYAASLNFAQDVEAGTTATIIIVAVTIVSIAGLCVAIIIRKRRLQNN